MAQNQHQSSFVPSQVARGNRAVAIGTSLVSQGLESDSEEESLTTRSPYNWAQQLLGQRFTLENKGVSGQTTLEVLSRLEEDALDGGYDVVIVDVGTNDMRTEPTSRINRESEAIYKRVLQSGAICVVVAMQHRDISLSTWTKDENEKAVEINTARRLFCEANPNAIFCDVTKYFVDPDNSDGDPISGYTNDGTHYTPKGAYAAGLAVKEVLEHIFPVPYDLLNRSSLVVDGDDLINGPFVTNPSLTGTSGSTNANTSGDVATGYKTERATGTTGTMALTKGTKGNGDPTNTQIMTFDTSGGTGSGVEEFRFRTSSSDITTASTDAVYEAVCEVDVGGWEGWYEITLELIDQGVSPTKSYRSSKNSLGNSFLMTDQPFTATLRTPPMTPSTSTIRVRLSVSIDAQVASDVNSTVTLSNFCVRRIG